MIQCVACYNSGVVQDAAEDHSNVMLDEGDAVVFRVYRKVWYPVKTVDFDIVI